VSTLYNGAVNGSAPAIVPLVVRVPGGLPTGIVFNDSAGGVTAPARFIAANLLGTIAGWAPNVPLNNQYQVHSTVPGASFTGLANLTTDTGSFLFAADFAGGRIDVFDSSWNQIPSKEGFRDRQLPRGYSPFNVQALGGKLYLAYAKVDRRTGRADRSVDVFNADGKLLDRLVRGEGLHAPLGLWALRSGNGVLGDRTDLVFSAGIEDETHGLLGIIEPASG
jgi:uncharacterized protein (TIGR03118 family)